jgi:hypothetical protein
MVGADGFNAPANVCLQFRPIFTYKRTGARVREIKEDVDMQSVDALLGLPIRAWTAGCMRLLAAR